MQQSEERELQSFGIDVVIDINIVLLQRKQERGFTCQFRLYTVDKQEQTWKGRIRDGNLHLCSIVLEHT
jgi:hypothetical protein